LAFFTTYFDTSVGEEVFQPKAVAIKYLNGEFFLDFVSTVDFSWLLNNVFGVANKNVLYITKLFKLTKVVRVRKLDLEIRNSTVSIDIKTNINILFVVLKIIIYWHTTACLFWLVFKQQ
jgi:hypothetical protein